MQQREDTTHVWKTGFTELVSHGIPYLLQDSPLLLNDSVMDLCPPGSFIYFYTLKKRNLNVIRFESGFNSYKHTISTEVPREVIE